VGELAGDGADGALPALVRQDRIAVLVAEHGFVRVRDLTSHFGVSAVTLRSDLDALERRGELRRVHGGAMPVAGAAEPSFEQAATALAGQKRAIGQAAAALVNDGDAVIIDVGTTTTAMAKALADRTDLTEVTVFTSGINIAFELERAAAWVTVIVTGGTLRPKQHSLVNPLATGVFEHIRASTVFLGCNGFDLEAGVTNINLPEAEVKQAMVRAARRTVVLADATKLAEVALAPVCPAEAVDVLVTDDAARMQFLTLAKARGIDVVVAP
jgi:DeoR family transcriptional regulator, aga operon transcriptional repressor